MLGYTFWHYIWQTIVCGKFGRVCVDLAESGADLVDSAEILKRQSVPLCQVCRRPCQVCCRQLYAGYDAHFF